MAHQQFVETTTEDESPGTTGASSGACLTVVLEAERPLQAPSRHLLGGVDMVALGRDPEARACERRSAAGERQLHLRVPDRWMSSQHATLRRVLGRWVVEDAGSKNGTFRNGLRIHTAELADGDVLELGHTFFVFRLTDVAGVAAAPDETLRPDDSGLQTLSLPLGAQLDALARVAASNVPVVLRGETGTGKEVVARAVHRLSGRAGPLQAVNCGALPDQLVESELFGYKKGAFSGAYEDRPGLVRAADGGTLFLDEIGDLPQGSQAKLLRVLQEGEVTPVGATRPLKVDVRLVVATHKDLEGMAARGEFREDLLARVAGFTLRLPPLRDRREDLGLIVAALLARHMGERASRAALSQAAARALFTHKFSLNVRELEKALSVASALAPDGRIDLSHLPPAMASTHETPRNVTPVAPQRALSPRDQERREQLMSLLRDHQGNVTAVARALGKARMQVQRWMKRFAIDPAQFRN